MKYGLVMEGGAMRGMYTCGILDVLMEQNFYPFDGAIGNTILDLGDALRFGALGK